MSPVPSARFEFSTSHRVLFGAGVVRELGAVAAPLGRRLMVVTGRNTKRAEFIEILLSEKGLQVVNFSVPGEPFSVPGEPFSVPGEPTTELVQAGARRAKESRIDAIIAIGGGSAMDAGKAIAALAANEGDLFDYLEVVGKALPLPRPALPCIAIPTTAGTGSEVTRNAVLTSPAHRVKASLRHASMLPHAALVDPELTLDMPPALTAATGMDALTQLIEPFVSARANPMTDALCREGIRRAGRALMRAFGHGHDLAAREDMALASLFSGMALANAGLGAVHGLAAPLGGMFNVPHGAVCAILLPQVIQANLQAMARRAEHHPARRRYAEIARLLTGSDTAEAGEAAAWASNCAQELGIPPLRQYGVTESDLEVIAQMAAVASSMSGNPIPLTHGEIMEIVRRAL